MAQAWAANVVIEPYQHRQSAVDVKKIMVDGHRASGGHGVSASWTT